MKKKFWILALLAVTLVVASCSKDEGTPVPSRYVGTWTCQYYCDYNNKHIWKRMYEENGDPSPSTTVTVNDDWTCNCSGMLINGNCTWEICYEKVYEKLFAAKTIFHEKEKNDTVVLNFDPGDKERAFVWTGKYPNQWFIFEKEKIN